MLTKKKIDQYSEDGFLIIPHFVEASECEALRSRAEQMVSNFDPAGLVSIFSTNQQNRIADDYFLNSGDKIRFFFEEGAFLPDGQLKNKKERSINKIGHALHDLDETFNRFSRGIKIKQLIEDLKIRNPLLLQSMYIFKQPGIGGEVNCHQDSTFLYTEPTEIVGLWFALENATLENGCLWVLPGGHKQGLKSRWIRSGDRMAFKTFNSEPWPENELIPLEVKKGTLILLHGLMPHLSLANRSDKSRHAYTLHVISGAAVYPEDNWLQREIPLRGF